ncbi:uncharacterized protein SPPG_05935 [Spizellomyces punctatus DAOM BR117]|uniref:BRCT domain-containing protein n=1 Tax=Spizellomyces punctatus (strain DAOM BR117) TaxID=645134 RepID=A0A0L0HBK3_SPIPD|nr:uncharacterized protein SPPG_05935 [Spizellomyces punctatus DAOM BR117]KNC98980.1 hypothetical protein SPPG_05935 [Spizellomyces punctatus DAOM BR117]|eukprot:XP_016607020.1 hypothetical protein SPPG_05935 [Spizellomyces punctatus DAOM BR117]
MVLETEERRPKDDKDMRLTSLGQNLIAELLNMESNAKRMDELQRRRSGIEKLQTNATSEQAHLPSYDEVSRMLDVIGKSYHWLASTLPQTNLEVETLKAKVATLQDERTRLLTAFDSFRQSVESSKDDESDLLIALYFIDQHLASVCADWKHDTGVLLLRIDQLKQEREFELSQRNAEISELKRLQVEAEESYRDLMRESRDEVSSLQLARTHNDEKTTIRAEMKAMEKQLIYSEEKVTRLEANLLQKEEDFDRCHSELKRTNEHLQTQQEAFATAETLLQERDTLSESLHTENQQLKAELQSLRSERETYISERSVHDTAIADMEAILNALQIQIKESDTKHRSVSEQWEAERKYLTSALKTSQEEAARVQADMDVKVEKLESEVAAYIKEKELAGSMMEALHLEVDGLRQKIESLEGTITELRALNEATSGKLERSRSESTLREATLSTLQSDLEQARMTTTWLQEKIVHLEAQKEQMAKDKMAADQQLKSALEAMEHERDGLRSQAENLDERNKELQAEKDSIMNDLRAAEQCAKRSLEELQCEYSQIQETKEQMQTTIRTLEDTLEATRTDNAQLESTKEQLQSTVHTLENTLEATRADNAQVLNEKLHILSELTSKLDAVQTERDQLHLALKDLQEKLTESTATNKRIAEDYQHARSEWTATLASTEIERDEKTRIVTLLEEKISQAEVDKDNLIAEHQQTVGELREMEQNLKRTLEVTEERRRDIAAAAELLEGQLTEFRMGKEQSDSRIAQLQESLSDSEKKLVNVLSEKESLSVQNACLQTQVSVLEESHEKLEKEISELRAAVAQCESLIEELRTQLQQKNDENKSLTEAVCAAKEVADRLMQEKIHLQNELDTEQDAHVAVISDLQATVDTLRAELRDKADSFESASRELALVRVETDRLEKHLRSTISAKEAELEDVRIALREKTDDFIQLQAAMDKAQLHANELKRTHEDLLVAKDDELETLKSQCLRYQGDLDEMALALDQARMQNNDELENLKKNIVDLTRDLAEKTSLLTDTTLATEELRARIDTADLKSRSLQDLLRKETEDKTEAERRLRHSQEALVEIENSLRQECETLKIKLNDLESTLVIVQKERDQLILASKAVENELAESRAMLASETIQRQTAEDLCIGRAKLCESLEDRIKALEGQLEARHVQRKESSTPSRPFVELTSAPKRAGDHSPSPAKRLRISPSTTPGRLASTQASAVTPTQSASHQTSISTPASTARSRSTYRFIICFSGFKEGTEFNSEMKRKLVSAIKKLPSACTVAPAEWDGRITHVISAPGSRTLKTFAAALTGKWIITNPKWVLESANKKTWEPENAYGFLCTDRPFAGRRFYMAPSFLELRNVQNKQFRIPYARTLLEISGGIVVETSENADIALIGDNDATDHGVPTMDWNTFAQNIPQPST